MIKFEKLTCANGFYSDCEPDEAPCHPDYGLDCSPEGECGPEDGSDDPY